MEAGGGTRGRTQSGGARLTPMRSFMCLKVRLGTTSFHSENESFLKLFFSFARMRGAFNLHVSGREGGIS